LFWYFSSIFKAAKYYYYGFLRALRTSAAFGRFSGFSTDVRLFWSLTERPQLWKTKGNKLMVTEDKNLPSLLELKIEEVIGIYNSYINNFYDSVKNKETCNIFELEQLYYNLKNKFNNIDSEIINSILNSFDESKVIKESKKYYKENEINLKTKWRSKINIQTESAVVAINRYMLRPTTEADKDNLIKLNGMKSVFPMDHYLGIANLKFKITVNAMLKIAKIGQQEKSFKQAGETLNSQHGIMLDPVTIMSVTEHVGEIAFRHEYEQAQKLYEAFKNDKLDSGGQKKSDDVLVIVIDKIDVNVRKSGEVDQEPENHLALFFSGDSRREKASSEQAGGQAGGQAKDQLLKKDYITYLGDMEEFKKLVFHGACRNGYGRFGRTVILSAGAEWITRMKEELFPEAQEILDFSSLQGALLEFGQAFFNNDVSKYMKWHNKISKRLKNSDYKGLIKNIKYMENSRPEMSNSMSIFLEKNIEKINYLMYKENNYPIYINDIDKESKMEIQQRLNQSKMRWNINSAQYILTLGAKKESNKWFSDVVKPVKDYYSVD
jgi:hypothetical protein